MPEYPSPPHPTRTILSRSPYFDVGWNLNHAESWGWGLDDYDTRRTDARLQTLTENVFRLLLGSP